MIGQVDMALTHRTGVFLEKISTPVPTAKTKPFQVDLIENRMFISLERSEPLAPGGKR